MQVPNRKLLIIYTTFIIWSCCVKPHHFSADIFERSPTLYHFKTGDRFIHETGLGCFNIETCAWSENLGRGAPLNNIGPLIKEKRYVL